MAHRIANTIENKVVVNKFGAGKHGYTDVFPNATRLPEDIVNMVGEEIARAVEPELGLNDPEVSISDPKYNQLQQLLYGIPSAQAAMNWQVPISFAASGTYYTACTASPYAADFPTTGFHPGVIWGDGFKRVILSCDGYEIADDQGKTEDPRACVDINFALFGQKAIVVVGTGGYIFRSTDVATDTEPVSGVTEDLLSVAWDGIETLVACGEGGVCIRSEDAGITWSNAKPVGSNADDFKKVLFVDGDFLLFQDNFKVYVSATGDTNDWDERNSGLVSTSDACYLPLMNRIVAAGSIGDPGDIAYSQDKFLTSSNATLLQMRGAVYSIASNPQGSVMLVTGQDTDGNDIAACNVGGSSNWKYFAFRDQGAGFALDPLAKLAFFYGRFFIPGSYEYTRWTQRAWMGS